MNNKNRIVTIFLFAASYFGLFIIWGFVINALLVPWDGTLPKDRPPLGELTRTFNDYFEVGVGAYLPLVILLAISLLLIVLRIRNQGAAKTHQVLEHAAVSNLLYIGLLITLFFLYSWIMPPRAEAAYSLFGIIVNLAGIIALLVVQYTGYTLEQSRKD